MARVPSSDPASAKKLLNEALSLWKEGDSMESLKKRQPPIYFIEDLWRSGNRLTSYQISDEGTLVGTNVRFQVELQGMAKTERPWKRTVNYLVTTTPAITICREE